MEFCDLYCAHAKVPEENGIDGSGSCRTFIALYCTLKKRLVTKNAPCRDKAERGKEQRDVESGQA
ncbi:MAG: hypothetical protein RDV48_00035 [Candidatus Eremiobacteraeota bacterium]|nr:hypothetical protein [Candidatus Eremiobacteraeota bacterium]